MCLILMALSSHPRYPLIVLANRDEFYARPTADAAFWDDAPHVLAGCDLREGGTWLGISKSGRFAAVTNVRGPDTVPDAPVSRGQLVGDFLLGNEDTGAYVAAVAARGQRYRGFNLVAGTGVDFHYYANRGDRQPEPVTPGIHALSNHLLNTPWPKVERAKANLGALLAGDRIETNALLDLLLDRTPAAKHELPDTGISREREQQLSPIFVRTAEYGTRSSTLLLIDVDGEVSFTERTFVDGHAQSQRSLEFSLQDVPA